MNLKIRTMLLILLFGVLFTSCSDIDKDLQKEDKIQKQLAINAAQKLTKEKGLVFIGWGGNGNDKFELMDLTLNYFEPLDIKKGRELLVYSIQVFLDEINSNKEIRPYLIQYPFTDKNVQVAIIVRDPANPPFDLKVVKLVDGKISYLLPDKKTIYKPRHEETYAQALQELAKENPPK